MTATPHEAAQKAMADTGDWEMAVEAALVAARFAAPAEPKPAPVSPDLECTACAPGVTPPHGVNATPGQALSPDPADFAYHVRATAFNVLTGKMAGDEWSVPRSERDAIARAVVDAVEPLIRADERAAAAQEPHAAAELAALREGITALASQLDASARATSPSKKSNIEAECAIALRKLLEGK